MGVVYVSVLKRDGRHGKWAHPLAVMLFVFGAAIAMTLLAHDYLFTQHSDSYDPQTYDELFPADSAVKPPTLHFHPGMAYFFVSYVVVMILCRYVDCGSYIFYESVWCCNTSLLLAAIGILTHRPLVVGASVAGVMCDQMMWYIDCVGYLLLGKFKVGVAKYLVWPQTSWSKKYLCTHHLWFLPAALYALGWHLPTYSFILSCIFTSTSTGLCRFVTPKTWKDVYNNHTHYMNVNAGHEFWADVKIPLLHYFDRSHPAIYLPFMMVCVNTGLNGPFVLALDWVTTLL